MDMWTLNLYFKEAISENVLEPRAPLFPFMDFLKQVLPCAYFQQIESVVCQLLGCIVWSKLRVYWEDSDVNGIAVTSCKTATLMLEFFLNYSE